MIELDIVLFFVLFSFLISIPLNFSFFSLLESLRVETIYSRQGANTSFSKVPPALYLDAFSLPALLQRRALTISIQSVHGCYELSTT